MVPAALLAYAGDSSRQQPNHIRLNLHIAVKLFFEIVFVSYMIKIIISYLHAIIRMVLAIGVMSDAIIECH